MTVSGCKAFEVRPFVVSAQSPLKPRIAFSKVRRKTHPGSSLTMPLAPPLSASPHLGHSDSVCAILFSRFRDVPATGAGVGFAEFGSCDMGNFGSGMVSELVVHWKLKLTPIFFTPSLTMPLRPRLPPARISSTQIPFCAILFSRFRDVPATGCWRRIRQIWKLRHGQLRIQCGHTPCST